MPSQHTNRKVNQLSFFGDLNQTPTAGKLRKAPVWTRHVLHDAITRENWRVHKVDELS